MKKRKLFMRKYTCDTCVAERLKGRVTCTYEMPQEEDSQGWCISQCPIFGDKLKPDWKFVSETVIP